MTAHKELIERLRFCAKEGAMNFGDMTAAADALESQALEMEGLRKQLSDSAKCAFEAMPHDIPTRMKRKICVDTDWSGSLASRAYIEIRKAFTGEPYKANETLDKALTSLAAAESLFWEACQPHGKVGEVVYMTYKTRREAAMAAKGVTP